MERALIALSALLFKAVIGGWMPARVRQWASAPAKILRDLERRLNRETRSLEERRLRGVVLTVFATMTSLTLGWMCNGIFRHEPFLEWLLVVLLLPVRQGWDIASRIRKALVRKQLPDAKAALAESAWRHYAFLDEYGLARAGIETLAIYFSEKLVGLILWYLLLGLPGLFVAQTLTIMQETLLKPAPDASEFGRAATWAHDILHYVSSRLAALLWLAASWFTLAGKNISLRALGTPFIQAPPQRLMLLVTALALNLSLGGSSSIYTQGQWLGSGNPKPQPQDIKRALHIFLLAGIFLFVLLGLLI